MFINAFKSGLFIILAVAMTVMAAGAERKINSIAVLDLEGSGLDAGEVKTLSEALRNSVINNNVYTVLERGKMDVILKEQGFQQSGACTNDACAVEMGQLLGVDAMMVGSIGKVGKTYSLTVRLLDIGTSRIIRSVSQFYKGEIDGLLTETIQDISKKICVRDTKSEPAAPTATPAAIDAASVKKDKVAEAPAGTAAPAVEQGKSNTWMYVAIGAAALAGGIGLFIILNGSTEKTPTPSANDRPVYPDPPSGLLPQREGGSL